MALVRALWTASVGNGAGGSVLVTAGQPFDDADNVVTRHPTMFAAPAAGTGAMLARTTAAVRDGAGGTTTVRVGTSYTAGSAVVTANPSLFVSDEDCVFARQTVSLANGAGGSVSVLMGQPFASDDAIVTANPALFVAAGGETPAGFTLVREATGTSTSPALGVGATAGHLLVLCVAERNNTGEPNAISGPSAAGWTEVDQHVATGGLTPRAAMWYKVASGGETSGGTLAAANGGTWAWWIADYSGNTVSPFDVSAKGATGGTLSCPTGTTSATAQASELAIGMWSIRDNPGTTSYNNSFIEEAAEAATTTTYLKVATKVLSSTGTQTCTASWANNVRAAAIIATFKAA